MGVMECDRIGCDSIMCHKISDCHGYICHECFEELKDFMITEIKRSGVIPSITTFMNRDKREIPFMADNFTEGLVENALNKEFRDN
jgi:hypothetical protein